MDRHGCHNSPGNCLVVVDRSRTITKRVAKAVLIRAVPPLLSKTAANPGGLPIEVFDGFRSAVLADRSKFYLEVASGPFFGFSNSGADWLKRFKPKRRGQNDFHTA